MKQVLCNHFPMKGYKALALFPFIFIRRTSKFTGVDLRHEEIHGRQQKEMTLVLFLIAYGIAWCKEVVHCAFDGERGQYTDSRFKKRNIWRRVMHTIIFEREAYTKESDENYLATRKRWAWIKY